MIEKVAIVSPPFGAISGSAPAPNHVRHGDPAARISGAPSSVLAKTCNASDGERRGERAVLRGGADVHLVRALGHLPLLRRHVPVAHVAVAGRVRQARGLRESFISEDGFLRPLFLLPRATGCS